MIDDDDDLNAEVEAPDDIFADVRASVTALQDDAPDADAPALAEKTIVDAAQEVSPAAPDIQPPTSWDAQAKSDWSAATPAMRAAVAKRENEIAAGFRQYGEMLEPVKNLAATRGLDAREGIKRLVRNAEYLDRDPVSALQFLADSYGVKAVFEAAEKMAGQPDITPYMRPFEQRLTTLESRIEAERAAVEEARHSEILNQVNNFANAKPHFDVVTAELTAIIPVLRDRYPDWSREKILDEAYDRATRANPEVWSKIRAEEDKKRGGIAASKADSARRAAVSVKGAPIGSPAMAADSHGSAYDDVRAAFEALRN